MRHPARLLGIGCNLFSAIGLRLADLRHPTPCDVCASIETSIRRYMEPALSELGSCASAPTGPVCSAPGFLDSGLTVFASTLPRPARRGHVAPERDFDSGISPASTARCTFA